jgi:hypothetical protein
MLKRGDGIRWAVGSSDGLRSSTWRFWGNKKGDCYMSVRSLGGMFKMSFHRDRRCHSALTSEYAKGTSLERSRFLDKWALPDEPIVKAFQVVTPTAELRAFHEDEKKLTKWLPPPPPDGTTVVTLYLVRPDCWEGEGELFPGETRGAELIGLGGTGSRPSALLVHTQQRLLPIQVENIDADRRRLLAGVTPEQLADWSRALLFAGEETRYAIEIALS